MFGPLRDLVGRLVTRRFPVWYHPHYRLPVIALEPRMGLEPRRADLVLWYLRRRNVLDEADVRSPARIGYADLARVHDRAYLESLGHPKGLAKIFGTEDWDVPVDEVMKSVRLACGGTLAAARTVLRTQGPAMNLLGGFHHAAPDRGAGLCPVNDIAVALAVLRHDGFAGRAVVLDFDAHPPDGTADCLVADEHAWIGSISGSAWGDLPRVDETVLDEAEDAAYLDALAALLERMPHPDIAFVIAGGDVLASDRMGKLRMTLDGVRERDRRVAAALEGIPSVWLPGGGYHRDAWRLLAGTALVLANHGREEIPEGVDPLVEHYGEVYERLGQSVFEPRVTFDDEDLAAMGLGRPPSAQKLLGFYTAEAIEYALQEYGLLDHVRRLHYRDLHVEIGHSTTGDQARLTGEQNGQRHLLVELVASKETVAGRGVLYVNWLTLRHPIGRFGTERPRLPGQDVPGLGIAREMGELLSRMARRLGLEGVAFRPAWYHTAYASRSLFQFVDPARQGRFEALIRDARGTLLETTLALHEGRVMLDGNPYTWEADDMVFWLETGPRPDPAAVAAERERVRFTVG